MSAVARDAPEQSRKPRRRRRQQASPPRHDNAQQTHTEGAQDDDFALAWIGQKLGRARIEPVIVMVAGVPNAASWQPGDLGEKGRHLIEALASDLEAQGGHIEAAGPSCLIAYWHFAAASPSHSAASQPRHLPDPVPHVIVTARRLLESAQQGISVVIEAAFAHIAEPHPVNAPEMPKAGGYRITSPAAAAAIRTFWATNPGDLILMIAAERLLASKRATPDMCPAQATNLSDNHEKTDSYGATMTGLENRLVSDLEESAGDVPDIAWHIGNGNITETELGSVATTVNPASLKMFSHLKRADPIATLVSAAAIYGETIDASLLARALEMDKGQLDRLLGQAAFAGYLGPSTGPAKRRARVSRLDRTQAGTSYRFTSELLRQVAQNAIPSPKRIELHKRIAHVMIEAHTARHTGVTAAAIAGHLEKAGAGAQAMEWWCKAAEHEVAASAPHAAINNLRIALNRLAVSHKGARANGANRLARIAGPQLSLIKGNGARDVLTIYELFAGNRITGDETANDQRFDALWGIQTCLLVRGNLKRAAALERRLLASACATRSTARRILAYRLAGLLKFLRADFDAATMDYEHVLSLYDPADHDSLRHAYASDQAALSLAHLAWTHAMQRDDRQALTMARKALDRAESLGHPHTMTHVVCVLAAMHLERAGAPTAAPFALAGRALAQKHGYPYWSAWSGIMIAATEAHEAPSASVARMEQAIATYAATGARQILPFAQALLAERHLAAGADAAAQAAASLGLQHAMASGITAFTRNLMNLHTTGATKNGTLRQKGDNSS